jgi:hypothetical protein
MFSLPYPTDEEVTNELGDKFLESLVAAVRGARTDYHDMQGWRPGWFPTMHARCLSNLIHDRVWARLVALIESDAVADVIEKGATREMRSRSASTFGYGSSVTPPATRSAPTRPAPRSSSGGRPPTPCRASRRSASPSATAGTANCGRSKHPSYRCATGRITSSGPSS